MLLERDSFLAERRKTLTVLLCHSIDELGIAAFIYTLEQLKSPVMSSESC